MPTRTSRYLFSLVCILGISACDSKQPAPVESGKPAATGETKADAPAAVSPAAVATSTETFLLDGAATSTDTLATLRKRYGDANVIEGELPGAEGETAQGWIVFPDDPEKKLMIYLDESNAHPVSLMVEEAGSQWHLANSVRMGTDSKTLEQLNKKPFAFYGFYWDYGGVVSDWNGGELGKATANGVHVNMHLCPPEDPALPENYLSGDGTFKSDNPLARKFPPVVCKLGAYFQVEESAQ